MRDWRRHWTDFPRRFAANDHLRQVGKTVGGVPIDSANVDRIVSACRELLALQASDRLLDLCCGNGLLTSRLAADCERVVGVDFSPPLIETARRDHRPPNVDYVEGSVLALDALDLGGGGFNKVLLYEGLQHVPSSALPVLFDGIANAAAGARRVVLGSVPDRRRLWAFYDSPRRRADYLWRRLTGREAIGTWWERDALAAAARARGLTARFVAQPAELHTARYRFDAVLEAA